MRTHGSMLLPNLILNHLPGPYRWRGWETETLCVLTNKTGAGTYRGPGQYEPTFVRERIVDLLAGRLGMDRAEFRRRNLVRPEDLPYEIGVPDVDSSSWMSYTDGNFPETFDRLMKTVGYKEMVAEAERRRAAGECVGIGVTCVRRDRQPWVLRAGQGGRPTRTGTIWIHVGVASVGQGVQTVLAQVAADILEIPRERIRITHHDTDVIPEGQGAFSSRAPCSAGDAVAGASRELPRQRARGRGQGARRRAREDRDRGAARLGRSAGAGASLSPSSGSRASTGTNRARRTRNRTS